MIEQLNAALPSILSGMVLLAVGGVVGVLGKTFVKLFSLNDEHRMLLEMRKQFKVLIGEHRKLMECNRNQNKAMIVSLFEDARSRGDVVTPMELDTANRLADSYFALGGNHYIHTVIKQLNEMEIIGEPIELGNGIASRGSGRNRHERSNPYEKQINEPQILDGGSGSLGVYRQ